VRCKTRLIPPLSISRPLSLLSLSSGGTHPRFVYCTVVAEAESPVQSPASDRPEISAPAALSICWWCRRGVTLTSKHRPLSTHIAPLHVSFSAILFAIRRIAIFHSRRTAKLRLNAKGLNKMVYAAYLFSSFELFYLSHDKLNCLYCIRNK